MNAHVLIPAALLVAGAALQAEPPRIKIEGLPGELEWKNAPVSAKVENGALTIVAGKNTDWYINPLDGKVTANGPILLFRPGAEFLFTAKLTVPHKNKWDAGALWVWVDDKTWAKFAFELSAYQEPIVVSVVTRGVSDDCNSDKIEGGSVWFRIARVADAIAFYASRDGRAWKLVRAFTFGPVKDLKVGFSAQSPDGDMGTATFSGIQYAPRRVVDVFRGE
jgi:regulation of enolase protein 1 (concanavalin A-like superfamily)